MTHSILVSNKHNKGMYEKTRNKVPSISVEDVFASQDVSAYKPISAMRFAYFIVPICYTSPTLSIK